MSKRKKVLAISTTLGILILGLIIFLFTRPSDFDQSETESVESQIVKDISANLQSTGTMLAGKIVANNSNQIKIDSTRGKIKEVFVNEGDQVEKGQALFSYQTDQELKVKEAEVDKTVKTNAVDVAKSNASIKWTLYNQKNEQLRKAKNSADSTQEELSTLEEGLKQAQLDAIGGDNEVKNAESELEKANLIYENETEKLKDDTVVADNAGLIKTVNQDLVNQSADRQKEENFIEIIDSSQLFVDGSVTEFDKDKVAIEQPVEIVNREDNNQRWEGKVVQVASLSSEDSNSSKEEDENPNLSKFPYKVVVNENENMPTIGSHVYVKLMASGYDANKIILNKEYIVTKGNKEYVWSVEDNSIKLREITSIALENDLVEVTDGLSTTDSIAVPKEGMVEGMEVGENIKS
ncbi:efflux RND transporter periplasmic adaptor subunit [Enterococcus sp. HY326]|uniref:efflux RND transporter periplasmic adaptor subunit n=1 Tax=Enterococcus sp. HY326 TaxID=2971265 RepID=UPI00223F4B57|nr:efflux RND transporter periplasmic adaptor subunit [Enterococcus sp. HY326]